MINRGCRIRSAPRTQRSGRPWRRTLTNVIVLQQAGWDSLPCANSTARPSRNIVDRLTTRPTSNRGVGVMDQDRRGPSQHIVRVKVVDCQVVRDDVGDVVAYVGDSDGGAIGFEQVVAGAEVGGVGPALGGGVPVRVVLGGGDGAVAVGRVYGEVGKVGVGQGFDDRCDLLRFGSTRERTGCLNGV